MIRNGTRPTKKDHRDFDFHKSFGSTLTALPANTPDTYSADAGLTMPDQMAEDSEFNPPCPPIPEGCTDEAQADIATDLAKQIHNPADLEAVTHANADGGTDIRTSLAGAISLGWFKQYFNITQSGVLDWFDSFRLAQLMGVDAGENRAISWGTPWYSEFEQAIQEGQSVMPMPANVQQTAGLPWHNSCLTGWTQRDSKGNVLANGDVMYADKSWQGNEIGDKGLVYFPRAVINAVMQVSGTVAFTATDIPNDNPQTVTLGVLQWILSVVQSFFNL